MVPAPDGSVLMIFADGFGLQTWNFVIETGKRRGRWWTRGFYRTRCPRAAAAR